MSSQSPFSTHADPVEYLRVRWRKLKPVRESTIVAHRFDESKHIRLEGKPTVDINGQVLPPKFETTVDEAAAKSPARKRAAAKKSAAKKTAAKKTTATPAAAAGDGHQAPSNEENS